MWLSANPQLDKKGQLRHLLTLEGLPAEILWQILDTSKSFVGTKVKKVPLLRGKSVFNVFFEPSTRTRTRPARRPCSMMPRSLRPTASAGFFDTMATACGSEMPSTISPRKKADWIRLKGM